MGRSLKKRKLSKVKRIKVSRPVADTKKSKKKTMKKWEWWLIGLAFVFAFVWLIFLGKSGSLSPDLDTAKPTQSATPAAP
ncbi:hypothetical protein JXA40_04115 [bacterium]|nr:hypothetical protein [candidate division CSSED10-310 bacterium]